MHQREAIYRKLLLGIITKMKKEILIMQIIWFSIFSLQLFALIYLGSNSINEFMISNIRLDSIVYYSLAAVLAFCSYKIPSVILSKVGPERKRESDQVKFKILFLPFIIRLVFAESVSLTGFILGLFSGTMTYFYPSLALALYLIIISFPTKEKFNSLRL